MYIKKKVTTQKNNKLEPEILILEKSKKSHKKKVPKKKKKNKSKKKKCRNEKLGNENIKISKKLKGGSPGRPGLRKLFEISNRELGGSYMRIRNHSDYYKLYKDVQRLEAEKAAAAAAAAAAVAKEAEAAAAAAVAKEAEVAPMQVSLDVVDVSEEGQLSPEKTKEYSEELKQIQANIDSKIDENWSDLIEEKYTNLLIIEILRISCTLSTFEESSEESSEDRSELGGGGKKNLNKKSKKKKKSMRLKSLSQQGGSSAAKPRPAPAKRKRAGAAGPVKKGKVVGLGYNYNIYLNRLFEFNDVKRNPLCNDYTKNEKFGLNDSMHDFKKKPTDKDRPGIEQDGILKLTRDYFNVLREICVPRIFKSVVEISGPTKVENSNGLTTDDDEDLSFSKIMKFNPSPEDDTFLALVRNKFWAIPAPKSKEQRWVVPVFESISQEGPCLYRTVITSQCIYRKGKVEIVKFPGKQDTNGLGGAARTALEVFIDDLTPKMEDFQGVCIDQGNPLSLLPAVHGIENFQSGKHKHIAIFFPGVLDPAGDEKQSLKINFPQFPYELIYDKYFYFLYMFGGLVIRFSQAEDKESIGGKKYYKMMCTVEQIELDLESERVYLKSKWNSVKNCFVVQQIFYLICGEDDKLTLEKKQKLETSSYEECKTIALEILAERLNLINPQKDITQIQAEIQNLALFQIADKIYHRIWLSIAVRSFPKSLTRVDVCTLVRRFVFNCKMIGDRGQADMVYFVNLFVDLRSYMESFDKAYTKLLVFNSDNTNFLSQPFDTELFKFVETYSEFLTTVMTEYNYSGTDINQILTNAVQILDVIIPAPPAPPAPAVLIIQAAPAPPAVDVKLLKTQLIATITKSILGDDTSKDDKFRDDYFSDKPLFSEAFTHKDDLIKGEICKELLTIVNPICRKVYRMIVKYGFHPSFLSNNYEAAEAGMEVSAPAFPGPAAAAGAFGGLGGAATPAGGAQIPNYEDREYQLKYLKDTVIDSGLKAQAPSPLSPAIEDYFSASICQAARKILLGAKAIDTETDKDFHLDPTYFTKYFILITVDRMLAAWAIMRKCPFVIIKNNNCGDTTQIKKDCEGDPSQTTPAWKVKEPIIPHNCYLYLYAPLSIIEHD